MASLGGCVEATSGPSITTRTYGLSGEIPVTVSRPDGPGPFPAIVIMHDRSGVPHAPGGRGAPIGGDPAAWADSIREAGAFFDRHLSATTGPRP